MIYISDELSHYGVRGMKWGVRKQVPSVGGMGRRALAGVYGMNERIYRRAGNKTLASMNAQARNQQLKKAQAADIKAQQRRSDLGTAAAKVASRRITAASQHKARTVAKYVAATVVPGMLPVIGARRVLEIRKEYKTQSGQNSVNKVLHRG